MGIEKITDRIAAEAKADYAAVVGSAKQEARSILADAKAAAEKILADAEESGRTEKEKAVKYGKSAADIDAGKIILKKKQELLLLFTHRNRLKTGKTWIRIPVMAETAGRIKKSSARSRMTALPNS